MAKSIDQCILEALNQIKDILIKQSEKGGSQCCALGTAQQNTGAFALSVAGIKILPNNPLRLSFAVVNLSTTITVNIGTSSLLTSTAGTMATIAPNTTGFFSGISFPAGIKMEWYARAQSGTPNVNVTEDVEVQEAN